MRIPKSKMPMLLNTLGFVLDEHSESNEFYSEEDLKTIRQIYDRASLCLHGDGTALDIEVYYGY